MKEKNHGKGLWSKCANAFDMSQRLLEDSTRIEWKQLSCDIPEKDHICQLRWCWQICLQVVFAGNITGHPSVRSLDMHLRYVCSYVRREWQKINCYPRQNVLSDAKTRVSTMHYCLNSLTFPGFLWQFQQNGHAVPFLLSTMRSKQALNNHRWTGLCHAV